MEKNLFDNGFFSFKSNFMDFSAGGSSSSNSADLPRPSLGFPPLACDSFGAEFDMLDSSFAILDLSTLDFGRDSIAIYDIKSARNKSEIQSKDFQKEMFEICDRSLHQLPILFPKENQSSDMPKSKQEQSPQNNNDNNLNGSFKLTSNSSLDIFNKVFISYSTKSSIEELEYVKNSVQLQAGLNNVANLRDSEFAPDEVAKLSQNSPGNKSFDKEQYLLDFVPQPDFDEFNLSNEQQKTYLCDKEASPNSICDKPDSKNSETSANPRSNISQICKACQGDILQENINESSDSTNYSEDDIKKSIKILSEALNQKQNLSKFVLEKCHKMLNDLDNVLNGNGVSPNGKKSINNLDKEQKSATNKFSTAVALSDNKISEIKEVKPVKSTISKNKPLRATLPVEKMSKFKDINQQQSSGHVTPDKNVDDLTKLNKTITPSHESKRSSTPTSTSLSRLPKTTKPLFYSPPARKQVLKPCNGSERKSWASPSIKTDERPLLLKNHSFEGRTSFDRTKTIAPKLKTGFSNTSKTFSGLTKTKQNLLDLPSYGSRSDKPLSSGNTTTIQSRRASKENLKPFY